MVSEPLRFVHAGDFHLEQLPQPPAELPEHIRSLLAEASFRAIAKVFDAALAEHADALLLAGDVCAPSVSPREYTFLREQFGRLQKAAIPVYWAGGRLEASGPWPDAIEWPDNVHRFASGRLDAEVLHRDGDPVAQLLGYGYSPHAKLRLSQIGPGDESLPTIVVAQAKLEAAALADLPINYWALGGMHEPQALSYSAPCAWYAGSPQAKRPSVSGPRGCCLVRLDAQQNAHASLIPTDVLRWQHERFTITADLTRETLQRHLTERMAGIARVAPGLSWLVDWTLDGMGPLMDQLRHGTLASEVLAALRTEFGYATPTLWTSNIELEPRRFRPQAPDSGESMAKDFFDLVEQHRQDAGTIRLDVFVPDASAELLAEELEIAEPASRARLLDQVERLGLELLGAEGRPE